MLEREIRTNRVAQGRCKNIEKEKLQYEEDMRSPGVQEEWEAKERRERTMQRLVGEIEEDQKNKGDRAKDIVGKLPETPESCTKSMAKALQAAHDELKEICREQLGRTAPGPADKVGAVA